MDCIQPVAQIIIGHLWDPIARQVNYFIKIEDNWDNLVGEVDKFIKSREDLESDLKRAAEDEGKVPTNEVQGWLNKANEIIEDLEKIEKEIQTNKKCFHGWCLDCCSHYKLGKHIVKATQKVQNHRVEKNTFREIAVPPPREPVSQLLTTIIKEGTSAMRTLHQIWNWLMDDNTGIIGIWGKGGVGKTTLVKNINNKLYEVYKSQKEQTNLQGTPYFEIVIFVTVSRDRNIEKLRNDIGKALLPEEKKKTWDSMELSSKLMRKRFLLILDDMWVKIDLNELGVPTPEQKRDCKILITTRDKCVCYQMGTKRETEVKDLSDKEAWELFKENAGNGISSYLETIARDVCKECHGLPLAIIVIGPVLKKANIEVWEDALRVLRTSQFEFDMEPKVYLPLKYSYDHLKNDTLRNCFLYCSLFPEDSQIGVNRLIEYWIMEGFIEGVESLKDASAKGHSLLKELTDSCLLEKVEDEENVVSMHDVIRDMAIKITSESTDRGRRFLVQARVGLKECPKAEKWKEKNRISLMGNYIQSLPDEPKCTELSTLLLQHNYFLRKIPESFFKQMKNLRVLDLSFTYVVSLPSSISELGSLRALILRDCQCLQSVTCVGGLKQLQFLDLYFSSIRELPREIGQLTRLRRLGLSGTYNLALIPADIIVSLSLLEDLEMWGSSFFRRGDKREALIGNLRRLNSLSHFSAEIPNDLCTSSHWEFLLGNKRKTFHLLIRSSGQGPTLVEPKRRGRYLDITSKSNVSQEAVGLLQYAEILRLHHHFEVRTISAMGARNLMRLEKCCVRDCDKIKNVVIAEEAEERILPNLRVLVLFRLPNLRSIWEGNGTPGSFGRIENITIRDCDGVMHLFSSNVLQLLNSLKELNIISCPRMVEIVTGEVGNGVIALPNLKRIVLRGLLKLNRMWEGILSLGSLEEIEVTSCISLRELAIDIEKTAALEVIKGEREWWDSLEWQNDSSKSHFQNKFKLVTHDDPHLYPEKDTNKYFF